MRTQTDRRCLLKIMPFRHFRLMSTNPKGALPLLLPIRAKAMNLPGRPLPMVSLDQARPETIATIEKRLAQRASIACRGPRLTTSRSASMRCRSNNNRNHRHSSLHTRSIKRMLPPTVVLSRNVIRRTGPLKRHRRLCLCMRSRICSLRNELISRSPSTRDKLKSRGRCRAIWIINLSVPPVCPHDPALLRADGSLAISRTLQARLQPLKDRLKTSNIVGQPRNHQSHGHNSKQSKERL